MAFVRRLWALERDAGGLCVLEMEAAMVVCGNEGEMEYNGVFFSAPTVVCGRRFIGGVCVVGVVALGRCFAVRRGNRPVGGAGGGVEELTVQFKWFLLLN